MFSTEVWKAITTTPRITASIATAEIACDATLDTMFWFPLPLYCTTMTVPPVATATKTLIKNIFSESTILTALTAATPEEAIIAVLIKLIKIIKA
ncbi:hypothetical protein D3C71_827140 [compost metagenome]